MTPFKHILVATDFGEPAGAALDLAISVAEKFESKITLIHVYALPVVDYGTGLYWPVDDLERAAKKALDSNLVEAKKRYPRIDSVLAFGHAWQHILEAIKEHDIDAVFVGTHGRRWLSKVFLGSVADKIVRLSPVPVFIVPGPSSAEAEGSAEPSGAAIR